jgi:drug/metabolite transporter (DMT)-like permease
VVIASGGEPLFHTLGLMFCLLATAGRALKSVIQSILMSDPSEKLDPMSLLLYMSMISIGLLVPATLLLEPQVRDVLHHLLCCFVS